jgi:hypothetical protein
MEGLKDWTNENPVPGREHTTDGSLATSREPTHEADPPQPSGPPKRIYVAFPNKGIYSQGHAHQQTGLIYCQKPLQRPAGMLPSRNPLYAEATSESFSSRLVSLMVLLTTIFAAIGLLRMMITGLDLPNYATAGRITPRLWNNGSGPSPRDAVNSDYQHALTREYIKATDTILSEVAEPVSEISGPGHKKIKISANTFTSQLRGGIHNLKLKIHNGTRQFLDKVTVEVDFLEADGTVLRSERYTALGVRPQHMQTIKIPEGMPGVKIKYRISEVRSRRGAAYLQQI